MSEILMSIQYLIDGNSLLNNAKKNGQGQKENR